ncbi:GNAT family N-acetyltransferase [Micromonospora sp. KC606]|nr:GNAT family N-acetyltransferase [Micromonospora sp. KC606]
MGEPGRCGDQLPGERRAGVGRRRVEAVPTSPVFVVRCGAEVLAAAGYRHWPGSVAHLCVLTGSQFRNRGLARTVASSAVAEALRNRLLPQWRARPEPSRRLAGRLGFRELGSQLSIMIEAFGPADSNRDSTWAG